MKRIFLIALALVCVLAVRSEEKYAELRFDTMSVNLGTFGLSDCEQHCAFRFTNTGTAPLIINQVQATCGCTVPSYPTDPIQPGERGTIEVTYNGKGKMPGRFRKTLTVRSNARRDVIRLTLEGNMTDK